MPAIGVITAMIGIFAVAPRRADRSGMSAINRGFFISAVISLALVAAAVYTYLPSTYSGLTASPTRRSAARTATRASSRSSRWRSASCWRP